MHTTITEILKLSRELFLMPHHVHQNKNLKPHPVHQNKNSEVDSIMNALYNTNCSINCCTDCENTITIVLIQKYAKF